MYSEMLSKYIKVCALHFRKDYLLHIKREKGKAHRKKVMKKKEKQTVSTLTINEIISDKSNGKTISHLKIKAGVIENCEYFLDKKFTKIALQKSCEAYEIPVSRSYTKNKWTTF